MLEQVQAALQRDPKLVEILGALMRATVEARHGELKVTYRGGHMVAYSEKRFHELTA